MLMIDSDIIIWIMRGNIEIKKRFDKLTAENMGLLFITPVQIAEILAGVRKNEKNDTELLLKSFNCISIDYKIAEIAGQFMNEYQKSHNISLADALIASATFVRKLKLWTLNKKHYPMLDKSIFIEI